MLPCILTFLLTICFNLVFTEMFLLKCDGLIFVLRFMQYKYKRRAQLHTLNNLTNCLWVFLNTRNFVFYGSVFEQKNLHAKLSVSSAMSADGQYHSCSLNFQAVM